MEKKTDEQVIVELYKQMRDIFSNPTKILFSRLFTKDSDYITFDGQHLKGVEENFNVHKALSSIWIFKGAALEMEVISVKFLNESTVILIGKGGIRFRWQKKLPANRLSINTNVFSKLDGEWKIASFHNTRIKPPNVFKRLFSND